MKLGLVAYLAAACFLLVRLPYLYTFSKWDVRVIYDFVWDAGPQVLYGRVILTQLALLAGFAAVALRVQILSRFQS